MENQTLVIETCLDRDEISTEIEDIDRYNELAIDLGLDKLTYTEDKVNISPMNATEIAVYKTVCPKQIDLENYRSPIPLRVMEALAKVKPFLDKYENGKDPKYFVWVDEMPDPVLVAKVGWNDYFLIGRWGTELDTFNELYKRAINEMKASLSDKVEDARKYVNMYDRDPEAFALLGLKDKLSSIYWK